MICVDNSNKFEVELSSNEIYLDKLDKAVDVLSKKYDADIFVYNSPIYNYSEDLINLVTTKKRNPNVYLILVTYGGSPESAYKIGRALQRNYKYVSCVIPSICKSSGTLLAISANQIIMSDTAELGPLDIQVSKSGEIGERDSGLTIMQAMDSLQEKAYQLFETYLLQVRTRSGFQISTQSCLKVAENLTIGLLQPIYAQFDPLRLGDMSRALSVAAEYGDRLNQVSKNLNNNSLAHLVSGYPSHGFVIDYEESATLFKNIRIPNSDECELLNLLSSDIQEPSKEPSIFFLQEVIEDHKREIEEENNKTNIQVGGNDGTGETNKNNSEGKSEEDSNSTEHKAEGTEQTIDPPSRRSGSK